MKTSFLRLSSFSAAFSALLLQPLIEAPAADAQNVVENAINAFVSRCPGEPRRQAGLSYFFDYADRSRLIVSEIDDTIVQKRSVGKRGAEAEALLKGVRSYSAVPGILGRSHTSTESYLRITCPGSKSFFTMMEIEGKKVISQPKYYTGIVSTGPGGRPHATGAQANFQKLIKSFEDKKKKNGRLAPQDMRDLRALREAMENSRQMSKDYDSRLRALETLSESGTRF